MINVKESLITCSKCKGSGSVDCCGGHMCPGTKECYDCSGRGKVLPPELKNLQNLLKELSEWK